MACTDGWLRVDRVTATPTALAALARLREQRGAVILYQSGGCCDGSLPVCLEQGDLRIGDGDVLLGSVGDCPVYIDDRQYAVWKHTQLIIDVGEGEPEGFSLPAGDHRQFVTRSRVFSPAELASLRGNRRLVPIRGRRTIIMSQPVPEPAVTILAGVGSHHQGAVYPCTRR